MDYPRSYGPYTLLERLGRGGMSDVDLARQSVESASYVRFVVIKRLRTEMTTNPDYVRMFQDEARINAELQHANIAQVYSFGQTDGEYFLAMEYIAGADLREVQKAVVTSGREIPTRIGLRIVVDVLAALSYAHSRVDTYGQPMCIVHRDVNPRNIMLSARGEVKLIDFGVAKAANRTEQTVRHTFKGKFAYMAPEQLQEGAAVDQRADLYAMGLLLHELIMGRSPFANLGDIQIMQRILTGRIPALTSPSDFPDITALQAVHQQSLRIDPDARFQTADEMRLAIEDAARSVGGVAGTEELIGFLRSILPNAASLRREKLEIWREQSSTLTAPTCTPTPTSMPPEPPDDATISILMEPPSTVRPILMGVGLGLAGVALIALLIAAWPEAVEPTPEPTPEPITQPVTEPEPIVAPPEVTPPIEITPPVETRPIRQAHTPTSVIPEVPPEVTEVAATGSGRISVPAFPGSGLEVRLDGQRIGETPIRLLEVPAGDHSIEVIDPDGEGWVSRVSVKDGSSEYVRPPR
ncbi:MAG: serine/threonine protein kinase [Myxococcota bacterium]|jgi:serine/threonine protein kinase